MMIDLGRVSKETMEAKEVLPYDDVIAETLSPRG
jgi:hypothetical protein